MKYLLACLFLLFSLTGRADDIYQGPRPETLFTAPAEQAFLKEFSDKFSKNFDEGGNYAAARSATIDTWEMNLFLARKTQLAFLKNHPQTAQLSDKCRQYVEACIRWNYWHLLLAYPIVRANAQPGETRVTALPSVMLEGLDESKINEEAALIAEPYRHFLLYYVTYFNSKSRNFAKYTTDNIGNVLNDKAMLARQKLTGGPYQYLLARLLVEHSDKATPSTVRNWFRTLESTPGATAYVEVVKNRCGEAMNRKDEPKPDAATVQKTAPNQFYFLTPAGETVTLDAYKGKVVYLDLWASWCGPCRAEFPYSKQLQERLTKKQKEKVVFLYVSVDQSEAAWKNAIQQLGMTGEQGWSGGPGRFRASQYFNVESIPRYILINKKGQVVDANAKRPSSGDAILTDMVKLIEE